MSTAPVLSPTGNQAKSTTLTTTQGTWTGCNTPFTKTQQWYWNTAAPPNGTENAISGATGLTFTPTNYVGDYITVIVLVCDTQGVCSAAHSQNGSGGTGYVYVPPAPTNTTAPTISPSGAGQNPSGTVFTAAHGTWSSLLTITGYGYQWYRNGTAISGATSSTYTANCSSDAGTTLTVKVDATNADATSGWVTSSNNAQFVPCNTTAPTVSPGGTGLTVGSSVSTGNGSWSSVASTSYTYAWLRDGSAISGATGSSYTPTSADISHCITAKVTATNAYGSATATSSNSSCIDNHLGALSDNTYWSQPIDDRESLSVNIGNGNLLLDAKDLQLAGMAGFDLNLPRAYNSLYSSTQDLAGSFPASGWQMVASLHVASTGDVWYTATDGAQWAFVKSGSSYTPPAGVDAQLVKNGDGSFTLTFDGSNEKLNFNSSGVLQSDVDANGNTITFSWTSGQLTTISDSLGHTTSFTYTSGRLTKITDPGNRTYNYGYDSNGRLSTFTDPTNAVTSYGYDSSGRLNQVTDPDGNMTKIAYDANGRVYTITRGLDSSGNCPVGTTCPVTSLLYGVSGGTFCPSPSTETDLTDPNTHVTRDCYDNQLRVTGTMDPLGYTPTSNYTTSAGGSNCSDNQPCSTIDANGKTTTFNYQSSSMPQNLTGVTTAGTPQLTATYQAPSNAYVPSSSTDANTQQTSYGYDGSSNITSETDPGNATSGTAQTTYTYDAHGRMLTKVSPDGNASGGTPANYTTTYTYISSGTGTGLLGSVINPVGDKTTYVYDSLGRKTSEVDPNGNVTGGNPAAHTTTYTYDANDRLLSVTDPLGHTTTYTYDGDGNQTSVTDGNNHTTTTAYNRLNRVASVTKPDPDGNGPLTAPVTSYGYDAAGNKTSETDPNNHATTYTYDADNRLISQTDALGNKTTYTYDGNGNLLTTVDPRGNVAGCNCAAQYTTTNTYDAQNRLLSTTDPLGNKTTNTYDADGNNLTTVDPNGNVSGGNPTAHTTSYAYYPSGLLQSVTAPDGGVTSYTYDANGNQLTRTDANNHTTTYTYDYADELTSITTPLGNKTTYSYDADGNKTSMVDANGNATGNLAAHTTTYGYDAANRLTSISYGDGTTPNVSYSYDAAGNRTSMTDGAGTANYTYDNDNQVLSSSRGSDTFSYSYDPAGNILTRSYPGGTTATYSYSADEQLASVLSGSQTTNYSYDPASELTQTTLPNGYIETRTYDNAGRLTEINNAKSGTTLSDFAYTLDPVGNPTKVVQTGAVSSTTLYQYDPNNRLTDACYQATTCNEGTGSSDPYIHYTYDQVGNRLTEARPSGTTNYTYNADDQLTQAGTTNYIYDHNGNETQAGSRAFSYDLANRLTSATNGSGTTTYTYDGNGNRLSAATGGTTTSYLWDTNNDLPQLALERDGGGTVLRSYLYGVRRISMTSGGNPYYYLYDALGSVANLTSSTGATEWTYSYEPFGAIRTQTKNDPNAPANLMQFTGELLDSSAGLYDLRARQYDPGDGRFISRDPLSGSSDGIPGSSYSYASDAPTTLLDPSGKHTEPGPSQLWIPDPITHSFSGRIYGYIGDCPSCTWGRIAAVIGQVTPAAVNFEHPGYIALNWWLKLSSGAQRAAGLIIEIDAEAVINGVPTTWHYHKGPAALAAGKDWNYWYHATIWTFHYLGSSKPHYLHKGYAVVVDVLWEGTNGPGAASFGVLID